MLLRAPIVSSNRGLFIIRILITTEQKPEVVAMERLVQRSTVEMYLQHQISTEME
jgi:hypothetical protein